MSAEPDDLEKLLGDVRKTIFENERFLKTLAEDTVDICDDQEGADQDDVTEEEFEEL